MPTNPPILPQLTLGGAPVTVQANVQTALNATAGMDAAQKMIWFFG